jgi:transposase
VRPRRVWKMLLGIERAVVEDVRVEREMIVVSVRPCSRERHRCGVCGRRCPREDSGGGRRRWRALDLGTTLAFVEADAPRVFCKAHRVVVAAVPWARHDSRFTVAFENQCCLAGGQHFQEGGRGADARHVADGRLDLQARRR